MNNTRYHQQIVFGFAELFISVCEKCTIQRVLNQSRLLPNVCFPLKRWKCEKEIISKLQFLYLKSVINLAKYAGEEVRQEWQRAHFTFSVNDRQQTEPVFVYLSTSYRSQMLYGQRQEELCNEIHMWRGRSAFESCHWADANLITKP